jgi:hypothetical protein
MSASESHGGRVCARDGCGQVFTPKRSDARYHSDACRASASANRKRSETKRTVSDNRPVRAAAVTAVQLPAALTWDPPSPQPELCQTREPCPGCGTGLHGTPGGTLRFCLACEQQVTPPGVLAPYERGGEVARQVKSQRERDLDAVALAQHKGLMLAQLAQLAADKRLHPASIPFVDWYRDQVKDAGTRTRLDELADLAKSAESGIHRRHWWQDEPAAIEAHADDYEDQGGGSYPDAIPASVTPPAPHPVTIQPHQWPHGWSMSAPLPSRQCQVRDPHAGQCTMPGTRAVPLARVCDAHYRIMEDAS